MVPTAWLINTGRSGGSYGVGKRMKLAYTWRIIDAIHDGSLLEAEYELTPIFNLAVPTKVKSVPTEVLHPENLWANKNLYNETLKKLASLFQKKFKLYADYTVGNDLKTYGGDSCSWTPAHTGYIEFGALGSL